MGRFNSIEDVRRYLASIPMFGNVGAAASNFGLENITEFCSRIGNPQNDFKSIHVAGTNGKGTVCWLFESLYTTAGYKTGMFTSPHLLRYNERVRIRGAEISDETILGFFKTADKALEEVPLTYFEISTALAFWVFSKAEVDIAIIETGLGGRLDSTNIITPELSVITSIGRDHEAILGDTIPKIAKEKAGIIKAGIPVVVGDLKEEASEVIQQTAREHNAELHQVSDDKPGWENGCVLLNNPDSEYHTSFFEPVNAWNVAMVRKGAEILEDQFPVTEKQFRKSIEKFKGVPARFEKLSLEYDWYFSGSHNTQAIDAMMEAVHFPDASKRVLILSIMKDKVSEELLLKFNIFDEIYFYEMEGERAAKAADVEPWLPIKRIDENSYKTIFNELKTSLVICAGSFYFYPIIKRWLI